MTWLDRRPLLAAYGTEAPGCWGPWGFLTCGRPQHQCLPSFLPSCLLWWSGPSSQSTIPHVIGPIPWPAHFTWPYITKDPLPPEDTSCDYYSNSKELNKHIWERNWIVFVFFFFSSSQNFYESMCHLKMEWVSKFCCIKCRKRNCPHALNMVGLKAIKACECKPM